MKHAVTQTAYPDGTIVTYLSGMEPIKPKNLGDIMKQAVFNEVTAPEQKANVGLKKAS